MNMNAEQIRATTKVLTARISVEDATPKFLEKVIFSLNNQVCAKIDNAILTYVYTHVYVSMRTFNVLHAANHSEQVGC